MAVFVGYAEVLTPEHVQYKAYAAGIKKAPPGRLLEEVLRQTGGVYEIEYGLPEDMKERLRIVGELTHDAELLRIASRGRAKVSFEHLRGIDPQTRIVLGHRLNYSPEESERLRLDEPSALDPKNTIYIEE